MAGEKELMGFPESVGVDMSQYAQKPVAQVLNVTVAPPPTLRLSMGSPDEFVGVVRQEWEAKRAAAVVWSERGMTIMGHDRTNIVTFAPDWSDEAQLFFGADDHKVRNVWGQPTGEKYWDGDFAPVKFTRISLIEFMKEHIEESDLPRDLLANLRRLKLTEGVDEEIVDADDRGHRSQKIITEIARTNIPDYFSLKLDLAGDYAAIFNFEARVAKDQGEVVIALRVTNARDILRRMMKDLVAQLPPDMPKYYGTLQIGGR